MVKNLPTVQETWVFTAAWGLPSSCSAQASHYSGFSCCRIQALGTRPSVVEVHRLRCCGSSALKPRLHSCGTQAKLFWSLQDHPSSGIEPMSSALAGRSLSLSHQGSPYWYYLKGNETETQRGFVTWPRSHSKWMTEPGWEPIYLTMILHRLPWFIFDFLFK